MNQPISRRAASLWQLMTELFWHFEVLSWSPQVARNGSKELVFRMQLRPQSQQFALRWLFLGVGFLATASIASTILMVLGCISAGIALVLFVVGHRTDSALSQTEVSSVPNRDSPRRLSPEDRAQRLRELRERRRSTPDAIPRQKR